MRSTVADRDMWGVLADHDTQVLADHDTRVLADHDTRVLADYDKWGVWVNHETFEWDNFDPLSSSFQNDKCTDTVRQFFHHQYWFICTEFKTSQSRSDHCICKCFDNIGLSWKALPDFSTSSLTSLFSASPEYPSPRHSRMVFNLLKLRVTGSTNWVAKRPLSYQTTASKNLAKTNNTIKYSRRKNSFNHILHCKRVTVVTGVNSRVRTRIFSLVSPGFV